MDANFIKRNLTLFIYEMLKNETNSEGSRLNASEISCLLQEQYGVSVDRKTVYRCVDDLREFGYDVLKDDDGYYLGKRFLSDGEFALLIDGIESVSGLTPDNKTDIQEKLCKIVGKDPRNINNFLYENEMGREDDTDIFDPDNLRKFVELVEEARKKNKKIDLWDRFWGSPVILSRHLLVPLSEDEIESLKGNDFFAINPYQIFRDKNGQLHLLFYIVVNDCVHGGVLDCGCFANNTFMLSKEDADPADCHALFDDYDFTNYESLEKLLAEHRVLTVRYENIGQWFMTPDLKDICLSEEVKEEDGRKIHEVSFRECDYDFVIMEMIRHCGNIRVLPGSEVYDDVMEVYDHLDTMYGHRGRV